MMFGLSTASFTLLHVLISIVAIGCGAIAVGGMTLGRRLDGWTNAFLWTTIATSLTGFMFHSRSFGPPHVIGVVSLVMLSIALVALYGYQLAGRWRVIYVITAITALYLNVFVGVVQAFQKIAVLRNLAPTQSEAPFLFAQAILLIAFLAIGSLSTWNFKQPRQPTLGHT